MVLTSLTKMGAAGAREQEVHPGHAGAVDGAEGGDRQRADVFGLRRRQLRRNDHLGPIVDVLRFVVVELARRNDLTGNRGFRRVVAEHGAFDLAGFGHRRLDDDLAIEGSCQVEGARQALVLLGFRDADAGAQVGRLHEHRVAQRGLERRERRFSVAFPVVPQHDPVRTDRQAVRGEDELHDRLVHADRRRQHARADIGHVGELEQPLNRAVFTVGAVQHRKDDVEVQPGHGGAAEIVVEPGRAAIDRQHRLLARPRDHVHFAAVAQRPRRVEPRLLDDLGRRHRRRRLVRQAPAAVLLDPDGNAFVPLLVEMREDGGCRRERNLVLP